MNVGLFHPTLNFCGGAELVASTITNSLVKDGYDVTLFVNDKIDQKNAEEMFGEQISNSVNVIVKRTFFQPRGVPDNYQNVFRTFAFKSKCDILIDTYSNCVFPWTDICYIHFPLLNRYHYKPRFPYLNDKRLRRVGFLPYYFFEKNVTKYNEKLLFANSHFTAQAMNDFLKTNVKVLSPPVPSTFFDKNVNFTGHTRENLVVTISRFDSNKRLSIIPYIAKLTNKNIKFVIIGLTYDNAVVQSLRETIENFDLKERITVLTDITKQQMKEILKRAKLYLHTKVNEHFGISIAEAIAVGCLPIVHNSGGVKEFVPPKYRYENFSEAAQIINRMIDDWSPSKAQHMTEIAGKFKSDNFSKVFMTLFKQYEINKFSS